MNSMTRSTAWKPLLLSCVAALAFGLVACGEDEDPQQQRQWDVDDYSLVVEQSVDGGLSPLDVDFEAVVDGPDPDELTVSWDFGGLGEDEGTEVSFTFEEAGEHTVEATAERDGEVVASADTSVVVDDFEVQASAEPTEGFVPLAVDFQCEATTDSATEFGWEFGDGEQSDGAEPTYTYTEAGTYVATCTAVGRSGARLVDSVEIDVADTTQPQAAITASPMAGPAPLEVDFDATVEGGEQPYSFDWDLGDDSETIDDQTFTHTYDESGTYTVVLTVTDDLGESTVDSVVVDVDPTPGPEVTASASPDEGTAPLEVDFDAEVQQGQQPYSFEWDLGDDSEIVDDQAFTHTYGDAGQFVAEVTVTDDNDNTDTDSVVIDVEPAPVQAAAELVDEADECVLPGAEIAVDASGSSSPTGQPLTYEWSFVAMPADSNAHFAQPDLAETVLHVDTAGTYQFRVFVDDGDDRVPSEILTVEVDDTPQLEIADGDGQTGTVGQPLDDELVMNVTNECDVPMGDTTVEFTGDNAWPAPPEFTTEPDGTARTEVTLGVEPGDASITARTGDAEAEFSFTAEVGPPVHVLFHQPDQAWEASEEDGGELEFTAGDELLNPVDDEGDFEFDVALWSFDDDGNWTPADAVFDDNDEHETTLQLDDGQASATISNTTAERVWVVVDPTGDDVGAATWIEVVDENFDDLNYRVDDEQFDGPWEFVGPDNFEIGEPTTGPSAAADGDHVLATMLDDDYAETGLFPSQARLHLDELYPSEFFPVFVLDVDFTHHFEAPADPQGEDCALALGQLAYHDSILNLADYDGLAHCQPGFFGDEWTTGFATTDEQWTDVGVFFGNEHPDDELAPLNFRFHTSGDSENDYFYSGPGWYLDELTVEILASVGFVDFEPADVAELVGHAENGLADDQEAGPVVEFGLTDEFGNRVQEAGVQLEAEIDDGSEGNPEFIGIADDRGDNFQSDQDGLEASAETDDEGVVALKMYNDEAEAFEVDARIATIGDDSEIRVSGQFVGLETTEIETLEDGIVEPVSEPARIEIRAYDNTGDRMAISGIDYELWVDIDEPVEFTGAERGGDFSTDTTGDNHYATVTSDEDGSAELTLLADDDQDDAFDVVVHGIADDDPDTESSTTTSFHEPPTGDYCENPEFAAPWFGNDVWGSANVCADEYHRLLEDHACEEVTDEQVDVFFEFSPENTGFHYDSFDFSFTPVGELREIPESNTCAVESAPRCIEFAEGVNLEADQLYQIRLPGPDSGCSDVGFYLNHED